MIVSKLVSVFLLFFTCCQTKMEPYIVGGSYAKIDQFPHVVYLYIVGTGPQSCGGSLLTQNILLTAAHCFEDISPRKLDATAYVGSSNIEEMLASHNIKTFHVHEQYSTKTINNDIALCLTGSFVLGNTVQRVIIDKDFNNVKIARIAGWGTTDEVTGTQSTLLKMVLQNLHTTSQCRTMGVTIRFGMMCASIKRDHPSHGDSGSALVTNSGQQVGLVSFRNPSNKELVVYSNVSYFYSWIQRVAQELSCQ